jgi:ribosomal protein S18 acetylase RimI-like enzyme
MNNIEILKVNRADKKVNIVEEVLKDLPEWFGLPESTREYVEAARKLDLWVAMRKNEIVGYITLSNSSEDCAEIHSMGVKKSFHRKGIGIALYKVLEDQAKNDYPYIQVKTVDEGHYEEYDQTIHFYQKIGFSKLEVFPGLWDEWNPCLILVKKL